MSNISTVSSDDQGSSVDYNSQDGGASQEPKPFEELENSIVSDNTVSVLGVGVLASQSSYANNTPINSNNAVGPGTPATPGGHCSLHVPNPLRDLTQTARDRERHVSSGKENFPASPVMDHPTSSSGSRHETPNAKLLHKSGGGAVDVYSFDCGTPPGSVAEPLGSPGGGGRVRAALFPAAHQSARLGPAPDEDLALFPAKSDSDSDNPASPTPRLDAVFQKPHDPRGPPTTPRGVLTLASLTLVPPGDAVASAPPRSIAFSPGVTAGSSTCSSCVSSPIILHSESQCFTYSVRRYVEAIGVPESPFVDVEGEHSLTLDASLVKGRNAQRAWRELLKPFTYNCRLSE